jgi:hypothetical protein
VPESELRDLTIYALSACGSREYSADVKRAMEVCVSAGKLSVAYMLLLYLLNGGGVPRYHPIPLPYVTKIEDICVVNPEGLAGLGVELAAVPTPEVTEVTLIKEEKESKKVYRARMATAWAVVVSYRDEAESRVDRVFLLSLTRVGPQLAYTAVEPTPSVARRIAEVCGRGEVPRPDITSPEVAELLRRLGYGEVEEVRGEPRVEETKVELGEAGEVVRARRARPPRSPGGTA